MRGRLPWRVPTPSGGGGSGPGASVGALLLRFTPSISPAAPRLLISSSISCASISSSTTWMSAARRCCSLCADCSSMRRLNERSRTTRAESGNADIADMRSDAVSMLRSDSHIAVHEAVRCAAASRPSSPKNAPFGSIVSISSISLVTATKPFVMKYISWPTSPIRNTVSPVRYTCSRSRITNCRMNASSQSWNSGTFFTPS
mmetsp:Transcript_3317/g.9243  ORF Transcript_3317/g.9243 Transcript_3317/m.9243 type:complete len:202 (-) Transcript_3317:2073-2678(-)